MNTSEEVISLIQKSDRTLWILCGLPYSGKTYIAKQILSQTHCVYVSIDEILHRLGYDWNTNKLPDDKGWKEVFVISYEKIKEALIKGSNVLYDSTNHTKASRDKLREVAKDVGGNVKIIYIEVPVELVRERWEENKLKQERFVLDETLLRKTLDDFEAPSGGENPLIIKNF